MPFILNTAQQ